LLGISWAMCIMFPPGGGHLAGASPPPDTKETQQ
jgi:hypothetical protein